MVEGETEEESRADPATEDQSQGRGEEEGVADAPELEEPPQKRAEKKTYEGIITFGVKTELVQSILSTALQQAMQDVIANDYYFVRVDLRQCSEKEAQFSQLGIVAPQLIASNPLTRRKLLLTLRQEEERRLLWERHLAEIRALEMEETLAGKEGSR